MKEWVRNKIRLALLRFVFGEKGKIVIASNGRSGSTMLWNAVAEGFVRHKLGVNSFRRSRPLAIRACKGYVDKLDQLGDAPFAVCKTHDTFTEATLGDNKYIFVYADPLDSALSVGNLTSQKGLEWFKLHQLHLGAAGDLDKLYVEDVLNYEGQLTTWLNLNREDVLCIYFDDIWARQAEISEFLGFPIDLPQRRARVPKKDPENINQELFSRLRRLKSELESRLRNLNCS